MGFNIRKASKETAKIRMAMYGPSGSGKTYTALAVAKGLGQKVLVIDTERGSSALYSDRFEFDILELDDYNPKTYIDAINYVGGLGTYDVVIIDSLSHAWEGKGGALELADAAGRRYGGNKWSGWSDVTPIQRQLVDTIITAPCHIIATMRAKTDWVVEKNERGKSSPRKVGLKPIQREGLEYEFDITAWLDMTHRLFIDKTRCDLITDQVFEKADEKFSKILLDWLSGATPPAPTIHKSIDDPASVEDVKKLWGNLKDVFQDKDKACEWAESFGIKLPKTLGEHESTPISDLDVQELQGQLLRLLQ